MKTHITLTDTFKSDIVDHDIIVPTKSYFNIYNNSLDEPFHKFWFYIENAKLMNIYNENSIFRFALNNKNEKNKKLIDYLKKLFEYIRSLFVRTYPDITFDIPWKEYDNYPYLMNFFANNNTICMDSNQSNKNFTEITKDQNCSILFELTYIQIMKIIIDNKTSYSLKFKFTLIMVQEKAIDIKNILLENINQLNNPKPKQIFTPISNNFNNNPMTSVLSELTQKEKPKTQGMPAVRMSLDPSVLLNKMKSLNKIDIKEKETKEDKDIPKYLEQKSKLKKVETEERTMMPILKREFEESSNINKQCVESNNKKITESNNSDELNNLINLDELDELDKLDLQLENLSNKSLPSDKTKNTNKQIEKIIKSKSDLDLDLELELENIARK